ncbi:iron-containing alcohol dehydrogenase [Williamsia serinedens]|uniref:1,3-propanediol dehydrogenase n=1 Tax=Williamsia serinedens TaxID=391736 RepID=A0ABT1H2J7_9NOCA|nr:iron-containing alcohol dehydrogenase [Williamsia serinedens]MCP2161450.1 1,3-propanediol dehydrogenase [Williamsia serinedens]
MRSRLAPAHAQSVTRVAGPFAEEGRVVKFHAPEIVFGVDSTVEAAHAARRLGGSRPLLVTDPGLVEAGWVREVQAHLRGCGLEPTVWSGLTANPKDHEITDGHRVYEQAGCDVLVALGGGSVMDAAKGIAILAGHGGHILDFEGVDRVTGPIPPLVMLPTTAGTGADVSQFCIVTDTTRGTKITILGRALVPDITVIDPRLLTTMPEWLSAATGLDALTHGVEAFVSRAHNPLTDHHALRAVNTVVGTLDASISDPWGVRTRSVMAQASLDAGLAFTNAILGAAHALSHQVGGLLDLPHGVINGVLLPHVIRFNAATDPTPFVTIADGLGLDEAQGPPDEAALAVADAVEELARSVGVPRRLGQLGVQESDIPRLATSALRDACMATNPRPVGLADAEALFRAAL